MKPSSTPHATKGEFYDGEKFQDLLEIEECPEGTIPVRHAGGDEDYSHRAIPLVPHRKTLNIIDNPTIAHEYAGVSSTLGTYLGAQGFINVWNPATNAGEVSTATMSLISVATDNVKAIEVGWIVSLTFLEIFF
ncbi:hypothetical protein FH972_009703 [Carpinus fangiana]|uniref:Neprosin domain-containing protein n=1 Tax=Carpinus fangiana TaxID=176857 RepID=A0A660KN02_9ROSI|nr:hypothetical protein FH972_009703 [Carpinus fangiana]